MPAYIAADAGGTLPWAWAEERLIRSRSYWVATVWPDGRPHVSPVWGAWFDGVLLVQLCRDVERAGRSDQSLKCPAWLRPP